MPGHSNADLESQLWLWIKKNKKEDSRLEFKLLVNLSTPGAKAEFIRDVIGLANSEGEHPRSEGYLVIGFSDGQLRDVKNDRYDGARFGQLLHSYISPPVDTAYEEFGNKKHGHVGVLIIKPDPDVIYVVSKRLSDDKGQLILAAGQS